MALRAPYPVHIAFDNVAFVQQVQLIIARIHRAAVTPWKPIGHGDIYRLIEDATYHRGRHSVRVKWNKGHATLKHFDKCLFTAWEMEQQHVSVHHASHTAQLHHDDMHAAGQAARAKEYKTLVEVVQLMNYRTNA